MAINFTSAVNNTNTTKTMKSIKSNAFAPAAEFAPGNYFTFRFNVAGKEFNKKNTKAGSSVISYMTNGVIMANTRNGSAFGEFRVVNADGTKTVSIEAHNADRSVSKDVDVEAFLTAFLNGADTKFKFDFDACAEDIRDVLDDTDSPVRSLELTVNANNIGKLLPNLREYDGNTWAEVKLAVVKCDFKSNSLAYGYTLGANANDILASGVLFADTDPAAKIAAITGGANKAVKRAAKKAAKKQAAQVAKAQTPVTTQAAAAGAPDPRDAQIAALQAQLAQLTAALSSLQAPVAPAAPAVVEETVEEEAPLFVSEDEDDAAVINEEAEAPADAATDSAVEADDEEGEEIGAEGFDAFFASDAEFSLG